MAAAALQDIDVKPPMRPFTVTALAQAHSVAKRPGRKLDSRGKRGSPSRSFQLVTAAISEKTGQVSFSNEGSQLSMISKCGSGLSASLLRSWQTSVTLLKKNKARPHVNLEPGDGMRG